MVVQLPSKVPAPPTLPPWRTRVGVEKRVGVILRRLGVSARFLYQRFDWVPEMTMTAVADGEVRAVVAAAGGRVVMVTEPDVDAGGTESRTYYVTR